MGSITGSAGILETPSRRGTSNAAWRTVAENEGKRQGVTPRTGGRAGPNAEEGWGGCAENEVDRDGPRLGRGQNSR